MAKKIASQCNVCGTTLTNFIAYLPEIGEICLECYNKAAQAEDSVLVKTRKPK